MLELGCSSARVVSGLPAEAVLQPAANVVVQKHSRRIMKMDILVPEICLVSKK